MEDPPSLFVGSDGLPASRSEVAEAVASRTLTRLFGAEVQRMDVPGGPSGFHDFDLKLPGSRIAVEVTTCIDPVLAGFVAAQHEHAVHEGVEGLSKVWRVHLDEATSLNGVMDELAPLLRRLEGFNVVGIARGLEGEDPYVVHEGAAPFLPADLSDSLFGLGVDTAWATAPRDDDAVVVLEARSRGGSGRTEHLVTQEVDRAAARKAEALGRAHALERRQRHLFVWLDPELCSEGVAFAMWSGHPSAAPEPTLPPSIDVVWVAMWSLTPAEGLGYVIIWVAGRGMPWRYPPALESHGGQ